MSYHKIAVITLCVSAILVLVGMIYMYGIDVTSTTVSKEAPCENNKALYVFEDGEPIARYGGLNRIHSGVFVGHGGKLVVNMLECGDSVIGTTYIADNQSFLLVDE
ncbi:hypothetical protein DRO27_02820 [Candidatus Bathyarchaeota archaeon]|nr:MAG: hypothetical protein DRO27_02820 [Candidatus Bathyarchaeota archaeon]